MKWKINDFIEKVGYFGPHCIVPSLYLEVLSMNVVSAAQVSAQPHAAAIIIRILHLVSCVSGRVIDKYLWILMYIKVCIEVMKNAALQKLLMKHSKSPNIHFLAIKVVKENGAKSTPTRKSAMARFTRNMFVLVLIPLCRITTAITIKFPNIANTMEIVIQVPKTAVSKRLKPFQVAFPNTESVLFPDEYGT